MFIIYLMVFIALIDIYMNDQYQTKQTLGCRYNMVRFITVSHTALGWQRQNMYQTLTSQQTPHTSPSRASYGMSIVRIWEKTDPILTSLHCFMSDVH